MALKVVCNKLIDAFGRPVESSQWLQVGNEYVVLAFSCHPNEEIELLFDLGDGEISWWQSIGFSTVDVRHPPNWVTRIDHTGSIETSPESWLKDGFWDDFVNGEEGARAMFQLERTAILNNEKTSLPTEDHLADDATWRI